MARRRDNRKTVAWIAGGAGAVVLALTGYAILSGDDEPDTAATGKGGPSASASASPAPTYQAPEDWTEPVRWSALPRGERTDTRGSLVGYPETTEGAVGMMAAANRSAIEGGTSATDEQLRIYHSYIGKADKSELNAEQIELTALETDKQLARQMGVKPGQQLPPGAYVRNVVIGYQVIKKSPTEVSAWLLARVVTKTGETSRETTAYTRTLAGAQWQNGDWRLTGAATERALTDVKGKPEPKQAAPGDAAFNANGWTAIREAS
ncbi:hypothetical protein [Streptomyces jumonjinensis]|uniref:Uncharacterized protein n=1 Tax=Streptomyces jumonjinensis TaxID=1945 RepID=A0A646KKG5_STRJU|nr:hypothetical protein [Streptomyces jumonjinensis]MQT02789.1 hypothetical protein [Streptomyces jumonjinensis]